MSLKKNISKVLLKYIQPTQNFNLDQIDSLRVVLDGDGVALDGRAGAHEGDQRMNGSSLLTISASEN